MKILEVWKCSYLRTYIENSEKVFIAREKRIAERNQLTENSEI